jgi:hypothetical protein
MEGSDSSTRDSSLPCDAIVLRAILRKSVVDWRNRRVLPAAFHRRPAPLDPDGISVGYGCSVPEYLSRFNKTFGATTLHVGRVRDIGLDVVPDDDPAEPHHALIVGVPYDADDLVRAEELAVELAKQARLLPVTEAT